MQAAGLALDTSLQPTACDFPALVDHYGCFVVLELILVVAKFDNVVLDFSDFGQAFVLEIRDTHPHCSEIENEAPHLFGQVGQCWGAWVCACGGATGLIFFHGPGCVGHGGQLLALLFVVVGHCCVCSLLATYFYTNIVPPTMSTMQRGPCMSAPAMHGGIVNARPLRK